MIKLRNIMNDFKIMPLQQCLMLDKSSKYAQDI